MTATAPQPAPVLADRLKAVRVRVRRDLEVTRHVFRGAPCYVVRDPITFQSHRLDPEDYRLFIRIDDSRPLGEIFEEVVGAGLLDAADAEVFYQFVLSLHRYSFLSLPVTDEQALFRRHQARRQAQRRQKLIGFLALQIPLLSPDAFLTRTLPWVRWLFSRWAFLGWLVLVLAAGCVAASRGAELLRPIHGLLVAHNLPLIWFTLIALKACHEFGHAYACRHFGGHVPEMGLYLVMFTPCAYVDATAAWSFSRRRDRLIVSLAGVYVELAIAAGAVFVWALTGPSLLNAAAYNVIFLASATTLLFNANPLMRFDGYYVLSDLVEVPNLRQHSAQYILAVAKRVLLGLPNPAPPETWRLRGTLLWFGVASTVYRTMVILAIAAVVASKLFVVGFALGVLYLCLTLWGLARRLARYLWTAPETAPVRRRAVAISVLVFGILPLGFALFPLPRKVQVAATVSAANETVVRAATPGFVKRVAFVRGQTVASGDLLVELTNTEVAERVAKAQAELDASHARQAAYEPADPAAALREGERAQQRALELDRERTRQDELRVAAPLQGVVATGLRPTQTGQFLRLGDPVAVLIAGAYEVRAVLTADEFAAAAPALGQVATFRPAGAPAQALTGTITRIQPAASRKVELAALTHAAGGWIAVDPTGEAQQPYLEVTITLETADAVAAVHGMTGTVQLSARAEPAAARVCRRVLRFINHLLQA